MDTPLDLDGCLAGVPPIQAEALRSAALEAVRSHAQKDWRNDRSGALVLPGFRDAGFGPAPAIPDAHLKPLVLLASELTPAQRRFAEVFADVQDAVTATGSRGIWLFGSMMPIPEEPATIRRWLGLSPRSLLEEEIEHEGERLPVWRVASSLPLAKAETLVEILDAQPLERAIGMLDAVREPNDYGFHSRGGRRPRPGRSADRGSPTTPCARVSRCSLGSTRPRWPGRCSRPCPARSTPRPSSRS